MCRHAHKLARQILTEHQPSAAERLRQQLWAFKSHIVVDLPDRSSEVCLQDIAHRDQTAHPHKGFQPAISYKNQMRAHSLWTGVFSILCVIRRQPWTIVIYRCLQAINTRSIRRTSAGGRGLKVFAISQSGSRSCSTYPEQLLTCLTYAAQPCVLRPMLDLHCRSCIMEMVKAFHVRCSHQGHGQLTAA